MYASGVDAMSLLPSEPTTARIGSSEVFRGLQGLVSDAIGTNLGGSEVDVCEYLRTWEAHDLRRDTENPHTVAGRMMLQMNESSA